MKEVVKDKPLAVLWIRLETTTQQSPKQFREVAFVLIESTRQNKIGESSMQKLAEDHITPFE